MPDLAKQSDGHGVVPIHMQAMCWHASPRCPCMPCQHVLHGLAKYLVFAGGLIMDTVRYPGLFAASVWLTATDALCVVVCAPAGYCPSQHRRVRPHQV
jgi:hypothetical protein